MKLFIIGRNEVLFSTFEYLCRQNEHQVVAVITAKARPEYEKTEEDFRVLAEKCGARFYQTQVINETARKVVRESGDRKSVV